MTVGKCTNSINFKQLVGDLCHFKLKMCAKCKRLKNYRKYAHQEFYIYKLT